MSGGVDTSAAAVEELADYYAMSAECEAEVGGSSRHVYAKTAAVLHALLGRCESPENAARVLLKHRLTIATVTTAAEGHYGKRLAAKFGGPHGISMTVNDVDYSFDKAFRRMWRAALTALAQPPATQDPQP